MFNRYITVHDTGTFIYTDTNVYKTKHSMRIFNTLYERGSSQLVTRYYMGFYKCLSLLSKRIIINNN